MPCNQDCQNLLTKVDEKAKEVKRVFDELSKSYPLKDISTHEKYDEKCRQFHVAAQNFLISCVYQ